MIQRIWKEIEAENQVRQNLSKLREIVRDKNEKEGCKKMILEKKLVLEHLLKSEDPKTRKNAALLTGDLGLETMKTALWRAYEEEETLFVRASYVIAMQKLDMTAFLKPLKAKIQELEHRDAEDTQEKHIREELRELKKLVLSIEGIRKHKFTGWEKESEIILLANRRHLDVVLSEIRQLPDVYLHDSKKMNAGIRLKTSALKQLMEIRTWQEILFLVPGMKTCDKDPVKAAETVAASGLSAFLEERHQTGAPFYYRVEVKTQVSSAEGLSEQAAKKRAMEEKQKFVKSFVSTLEEKSQGKLINTPSEYEFEIRLVENKDGRYNVMVKLFTMEDHRFTYRKEVLSSSIRPVNAALLVQLAKEYMEENARVLDPFCGVGTMLIERQKKIPADTSYGVDIYEKAIEKARQNTEAVGQVIHFINRDCFTFTHEYPFDEIFTNMPFVQGKKTSLEIYEIYERFFAVAGKWLRPEGRVILYTHDKGYVDRLAKPAGFEVMKKDQINGKEDTWLYVLRFA